MTETDATHDNLENGTGFEQRQQRLEKLTALQSEGINPFGGRIDGIKSTMQAISEFEAASDSKGEEGDSCQVEVAGRLTAMREMGKSIFADLKDGEGKIQIYARKNTLGDEDFAAFQKLDLGDIISVSGTMFKTRKGEDTVKIENYQLLSKALRPLPEKWHGLTDVERRYRQRYLDLITNDSVRETFKTRALVIKEIRNLLDTKGFMEVETPMLQSRAGGAAARPFETYYNALECQMSLRIAPELYLKRLLVGGFEKIYELNRNFRNEGLSRHHNPEFTMMEVYQAYSDCRGMMELAEELITGLARRVLGREELLRDDGTCISLKRPWRRVPYDDLIREYGGEDWFGLTAAEQRNKADRLGVNTTDDMTSAEITHEIYEKVIENDLITPTFVTRLPSGLVPLAKTCDDDPGKADVFELEIGGEEIAPGYSELNDPIKQRERFTEQLRRAGVAEDQVNNHLDHDFLTALEHGMPPAGGMGIGIDRLLMLLTGAGSIRDVILFPQLRPEGSSSKA